MAEMVVVDRGLRGGADLQEMGPHVEWLLINVRSTAAC